MLETPLPDELLRGQVSQSLVGPDGIVHGLPGQQLLIEPLHRPIGPDDLIEFLEMRAVRAFHVGKDEQAMV